MSSRKATAERVQKIFTGWGYYIKTRLGIHEDVLGNSTDTELVLSNWLAILTSIKKWKAS